MKQPGWTVQENPGGQGPLVVRPIGDPGLVGRAWAGFGRQMIESGAFLTQEAREAEERTRRFKQRNDAADFRLAKTQEYLKARGDILQTTDEADREAKWQRFRDGLQVGLEGLADEETRSLAQVQLDEDTATWEKTFRMDQQTVRKNEGAASIEAAWEASIRLRDTSMFEDRLDQLAPIIGMTDGRKAEVKQELRDVVFREQGKDEVAAAVSGMVYGDAVRYLNEPDTWRGLELNPQEKQEFLEKQLSLLDRQRAQDAQVLRAQERAVEENGYKAIAAALRGKVDLDQVAAQLDQMQIRPEHALQATQIARRGPATENDPAAYAQLNRLLGDLAAERATPQQVTDYALANASRLKPATVDAAIEAAANRSAPQIRAVEDAVQSASRELVTVTDDVMSQVMALAAGNKAAVEPVSNQRAAQWRTVDYVRQQLRTYVRDNPKATADDIYVESHKLLRHLRTQTAAGRAAEIEAWETGLVTAGPKGVNAAAKEVWNWDTRQKVVNGVPTGAPAGLEAIWDTLTVGEQQAALTLLTRGWTPEMVIREVQR